MIWWVAPAGCNGHISSTLTSLPTETATFWCCHEQQRTELLFPVATELLGSPPKNAVPLYPISSIDPQSLRVLVIESYENSHAIRLSGFGQGFFGHIVQYDCAYVDCGRRAGGSPRKPDAADYPSIDPIRITECALFRNSRYRSVCHLHGAGPDVGLE